MSKLKYLTLIFSEQIPISNKIFDGYEWKTFITFKLVNLKEFNFKFPVKIPSDDTNQLINCLHGFRTGWWLNQVKWFVEFNYEENALVTVPNFSSTIFQNRNLERIQWIFNKQIYCSNISNLHFDSTQLNLNLFCSNVNQPYFPNVHSMFFNGNLTDTNFNVLINNIDKNNIQHIQIISTSTNLENFAHLINHTTNLSSLDLQCQHIDNLFHLIERPLDTIRRLIIFGYKINNIKHFFNDLYDLFPYLNYLTTEYFSKENLRYILNSFMRLEEINLRLKKNEDIPNHQWIEKHTRLKNYSCEINTIKTSQNSNSVQRIFTVWINNMDESIN